MLRRGLGLTPRQPHLTATTHADLVRRLIDGQMPHPHSTCNLTPNTASTRDWHSEQCTLSKVHS